MKRSRAFILTELLTGMMLQAWFLLVLCTAFYMMLSFYTRTQQVLTARDRGQRVIAYFDHRMRGAGLGMWRCNTSKDVREALWPLTDPSKNLVLSNKNLALPVAVTYLDQYTFDNNNNDFNNAPKNIITNSLGNQTYCGNILTLLYAERDTSIKTGSDRMNLVFSSDKPVELGSGAKNGKFKLVDDSIIMNKSKLNTDIYSNTIPANPYAVTRSIGIPFQVKDIKQYTFVMSFTGINIPSVDVLPMDELLYLKCVRVFVEGSGVDSNFKYQNLTSKWSDKIPHEKGILEIYMELDTVTKIFDLYVLSTGGEDKSVTRTKPENWPDNARWKDEYLNHALYVSHASWKLHNLDNTTL